MKVGDKVFGIYNEWIDHPLNYFDTKNYNGKIVDIEENMIIVDTETLGVIEILKEEGDTIFID